MRLYQKAQWCHDALAMQLQHTRWRKDCGWVS